MNIYYFLVNLILPDSLNNESIKLTLNRSIKSIIKMFLKIKNRMD